MPSSVVVFVCKNQDEVKKAELRLVNNLHFPKSGITTKEISDVTYNSKTFGGGTIDDTVVGGYIVIAEM
jgi:hypothetical protein